MKIARLALVDTKALAGLGKRDLVHVAIDEDGKIVAFDNSSPATVCNKANKAGYTISNPEIVEE